MEHKFFVDFFPKRNFISNGFVTEICVSRLQNKD